MNDNFKIKQRQKREISRALALITQIGLNAVVIIVGCILLGKYIDSRLSTSPVFLLIFTLLGMLSAFYNIYKMAMKAVDKKDKDE